MKSKKKTDRIFIHFVILFFGSRYHNDSSILWMILSTFKPLHELYQFHQLFTEKFHFENYKEVFTTVPSLNTI